MYYKLVKLPLLLIQNLHEKISKSLLLIDLGGGPLDHCQPRHFQKADRK